LSGRRLRREEARQVTADHGDLTPYVARRPVERLITAWALAGADCTSLQRRDISRQVIAPHGFREFGVQDPDGHDIAFGQRQKENST
jgi:hypothetical protein